MTTLIGTGSDSATIMIVSDYPSKEDLAEGYPLANKAGNLINKILRSFNRNLDQFYRTSVIKNEIPNGINLANKKDLKYNLSNLLANGAISTLQAEIRTFQPNVILALGDISLQVLTGEHGIDKFRGSILPPLASLNLPTSVKIIPTLHPRQIWKKMEMLPIVRIDYSKAFELELDSSPIKQSELIWICKTADGLNEYWNRASGGEFLTFDIETLFRNYISCISLCTDGHESISIPLLDDSIPQLELVLLYKKLAQILTSPIPKCNQNIKYDLHHLEKYFVVNNVTDDTMLLFHTLYPEFPKNLGFLTSVYTHFPYFKDEGKEFNPLKDPKSQYYLYNAKDALVTWQILKKQKEDAKELGVDKFYREKVMKYFFIYKKLDRRGILIDEAQRQRLLAKYNGMYKSRYENIRDIYGKDVNLQSPKQVGEFVYDFLKCKKHTHTTPSGSVVYSTDKETLEEIYINETHEEAKKQILQQIIICRKILTILGYINKHAHLDGRLRTSYNLGGTKSGRTSGGETPDRQYYLDDKGKLQFHELGCSLQVLPKRPFECEELEGEVFGSDIPTMFVPTPGYVFVEWDGKAAEAGVVCVLSEDYDTLDYMYHRPTTKRNRFGCKDDIHVLTAEWCCEKPFESITNYDRETYGKRPRHAGNYDMGAYRLSQMIHRPIGECEKVLIRFHKKSPKIRGIFHLSIRSIIDRDSCLTTPHGRRRDFFERHTESVYKEAYSYIPQAVVSDHTKDTMLLLASELPQVEFLVEKHDSCLAEVAIEDRNRYIDLSLKHYERTIDFRTGSLPRDYQLIIPCEIKWSDTNWGDMRDVLL